MDFKDVQICRMLSINSRISYREMGDALSLSVNSIHKRIQALQDSGIINRYIIAPRLKMLDALVVMVFGTSVTGNMKETIRLLGENPNTYRVVLATGNYLYVHGILRKISDMEGYISFVSRIGEMENAEMGIASNPEKMEISLSRLDYQIIKSLGTDSRKDLSEVSEELGISTKTIKRRFQRMLEAGAILPSIEFNPAASGAVICTIHLVLNKGVNKSDAVAYLQNEQKANLLGVAGLDNHPELIIFSAWAANMKELKALQDSIEASGRFRTAVPYVFYSTHNFDTWKDRIIDDRASAESQT